MKTDFWTTALFWTKSVVFLMLSVGLLFGSVLSGVMAGYAAARATKSMLEGLLAGIATFAGCNAGGANLMSKIYPLFFSKEQRAQIEKG